MPSNLSADERAAVEWVTKNVVEAVEEGARFPLNDDDARHLRTLLAVVARAGEAVAWALTLHGEIQDKQVWRDQEKAKRALKNARSYVMQTPRAGYDITPLYAHPAVARDRGDADDLLAEHLAGCGRCADAVTEGDDE